MADGNSADIKDLLWRLAEQAQEHAILLLDVHERLIWVNPTATRIFGMSLEQLRGMQVSRLFTPEDLAAGMPDHEAAIARAQGSSEDDRWQMRADGSRFYASGAMAALRDEAGNLLGYGKVLRNRTDVKEQLDLLRNEAEALQEADRHKTEFISKLSHELRNPLAPLVNAVNLLRLVLPGDERVKRPVEIIQRQVEHIKHLVDDLLDVTRISSGKLELRLEPLDLNELIDAAADSVAGLKQRQAPRLELLKAPTPIIIEADRTRMHQVIVNLVTNAIKYTPADGYVWVTSSIEAEDAVLRIQDTGIGIEKEMLSRIFDLFTQAAAPMSEGGLGIGLSLVKQLVSLHGGSVQAVSDGVGKGSEFTVRLPRKTG